MINTSAVFHLAFAVRDIQESREFYTQILKCEEGRFTDEWLDLNFFGHQIVCHLDESLGKDGRIKHLINPVDEHPVPIPHFGVVLTIEQWQELAKHLTGKVEFAIEPYIRFKGEVGEQATMFFYDPSGNALEIKGFKNIETELFAS